MTWHNEYFPLGSAFTLTCKFGSMQIQYNIIYLIRNGQLYELLLMFCLFIHSQTLEWSRIGVHGLLSAHFTATKTQHVPSNKLYKPETGVIILSLQTCHAAEPADCPRQAQTGAILPTSRSVHRKFDIKNSSMEEMQSAGRVYSTCHCGSVWRKKCLQFIAEYKMFAKSAVKVEAQINLQQGQQHNLT